MEGIEPPVGVEPEGNPYPGLASFSEEEAEFFFGREVEVESLREKLNRKRLLALIGPSGAGKTSLLRAGLLSAPQPGWRAVICTPGSAPFVSFARALIPELSGDTETLQELFRFEDLDAVVSVLERWRKSHTEVLVIIDQFEELFTQNPKEVQCRFAELLGRAVSEANIRLLLSMRDDFLIHCHDHEGLSEVFTELTPLKPPQGEALRRALVGPAERCGYRFEDDELVEEMLEHVSEERGALPLLAFAASRLWEKRDRMRKLLSRESYEEIGGVSGALAQHAESALERIGRGREETVREIFRNLVTVQGTRAARDMEELLSVFEDREAATEVLRALIDARLLTSFEVGGEEEKGRHRVEIIHESLLNAWPRLVRWQTQDQEGAQLRDELRQAAQLWVQHARSTDRLWTGRAVKEFQLWRERYPGGLTSTEEAFAQAMVQQAERRRRRRRFAIVAGFTVALAVGAVFAALWQQSVAETRRAEASKVLALGQLELERYPSLSVAYALKSLEFSDTLEARLFALEALQQGPVALTLLPPEGLEGSGWAHVVSFSPNRKWMAVGGYETVHVQPQNGDSSLLVSRHPRAGNHFFEAVFVGAGDRLGTAINGEVQVWSVPEFKKIGGGKYEEGPTGLNAVQEGFYSYTFVGNEALVRKWSSDGKDSQVMGRMEAFTSWLLDIDRNADWLAYGNGRRVFLRSLTDWKRRLIGEHSNEVTYVVFHPGGKLLATSDEGQVRLWSVDSESKEPDRILDASGLGRLVFDNSGDRLAAFGAPGGHPTVRLWNLKGPIDAEPTVLRGGDSLGLLINGAAFDPSGQWFVTTHANSLAFWPVGNRLPVTLTGHERRVDKVRFTPDGKRLVSASSDGSVRIWNLERGAPSHVLLDDEDLIFPDLAMDPYGKFVVVTGMSSLFIVPLEGGTSRKLEGFSSAAFALRVALDSEGRLVAAAPVSGPVEDLVIRIWDLESGESWTLGPQESADGGAQGGFLSLCFLPHGRLLSDGYDGLHLWSLVEGHIKTLSDGLGYSVVSRDGRFALRNVQQSNSSRLDWFNLEKEVSKTLSSHGGDNFFPAFDPSGKLALSTSSEGVFRVGPLTGEEPHIFFAHEGLVRSVVVSPDGQWIASSGEDGRIRLWPMPDMKEPPFHTLPYEELLERLRTVTNVRVVEDEVSATGYRVDYAPFPGWEKVPVW